MEEETASCVGLQRRESKSESESVMEDSARTSHVHLEPFHHQVAGQSLVFRYDASTICKSLIPRELHVYKTLPEIMKPHVPEYRGGCVVVVCVSVCSCCCCCWWWWWWCVCVCVLSLIHI